MLDKDQEKVDSSDLPFDSSKHMTAELIMKGYPAKDDQHNRIVFKLFLPRDLKVIPTNLQMLALPQSHNL
jgi:hypothetical protein